MVSLDLSDTVDGSKYYRWIKVVLLDNVVVSLYYTVMVLLDNVVSLDYSNVVVGLM